MTAPSGIGRDATSTSTDWESELAIEAAAIPANKMRAPPAIIQPRFRFGRAGRDGLAGAVWGTVGGGGPPASAAADSDFDRKP